LKVVRTHCTDSIRDVVSGLITPLNSTTAAPAVPVARPLTLFGRLVDAAIKEKDKGGGTQRNSLDENYVGSPGDDGVASRQEASALSTW
uniref:Uncharacterized protein n=1 Tax=Romanomermis culicivorax TaxID=13658 RepID=A0A915L704_ROMCU